MSILDRVVNTFAKNLNTLADDNNILGIYNDQTLVTKDANFVIGYELAGISLASMMPDEEEEKAQLRNIFFSKMGDTININIFVKRNSIKLNQNKEFHILNCYSKPIIEKWEKNYNAFDVNYYVILSTRAKTFTNYLEQKRDKITKEQSGVDSIDIRYKQLEEAGIQLKLQLADFKPKMMLAQELLSFYASYCNMQETKVHAKEGLLSDSYINSNLTFKKDYFIHFRDSEDIYSRFISVKAYDTEEIKSTLMNQILSCDFDFVINFNINTISKGSAKWKLDQKIKNVSEIVVEELMFLREEVITDRETMLYFSFSILVSAASKQELDKNCEKIKSILVTYGLVSVQETINQKPLYFSFFPSRDNLNSRKRVQTSSAISTICTFEKDIIGFTKNSWGEMPVTILKNISNSPYFFNFHLTPDANANGHCLIIGKTGTGKTTLMSFLMMCLTRYDINIFALDKLRGMHNFCTYLDGEYNDIDEQFKLNPFSLEGSRENRVFLQTFLEMMGSIDNRTEHEEQQAIRDTVESLYSIGSDVRFKDFYDSLVRQDGLRIRFQQYLDGFFDNDDDALSFQNQINILNMDSVLKDKETASLMAFYIFHKILYNAKTKNKGTFVFVDEMKDYLNNEIMAKRLLETILEIRKLNGVVTLGVQNLDFFDEVANAKSWIDNMAHFVIFPTNNTESLENHIELSPNELRFLKNTGANERKFLYKNNFTKESVILDFNLSKIGKFVKIFTSDSAKVARMKELKNTQVNWRDIYLDE
ncbi:MAG: ATP-binding protein [Endomicrobium sp.]|jgi:type IV secretion system protein VirB4/ComB4 competence protein|nr:ATP-binding protein [Endomicrobium sp.]